MASSEAEFKRMLVDMLPRLRRYAHALAREPEAGEDLAQSAAAHALRQQALYTAGLRFDAWLFRLTRNLWIDTMRRRGARPEVVDTEAVLRAVEPPMDMERRQMAARALTAFRALPDALRETAALVLLEGFTYQETAELLNVPIGTVMSRVSRARASIARVLLGEAPHNGDGLERHDH